ncbi:MAG: CapA family protein [Firmicutes bacterium]|nr:CapA family protein [Bacillota bacterium]
MKKDKLFYMLLSALLLTSCSNDYSYKEQIAIENNNHENNKKENTTQIEINNEEVTQIEENDYIYVEKVEELEENEHIDLLAIGDVLVHEPVYKSGIQSDETLNYDHFFYNIQEDLDEAEIKIVNQENVLAASHYGYSSYPCFNAPEEVGEAEAKAGFNVILHATNHTMDKGEKAVYKTMEFWNNYPEIAVLGINEKEEDQNNIYIYNQNGFKVALLNYTYGTNGIPLPSDKPYLVNLMDKERITNDVKLAKEQADIVVVLPHWGTEYQHTPDSFQKEYAQLLSDLGVDLVIGTHPHVLENIEVITNDEGHQMLVYYSLGNYVSGQTKKDRVVGGLAKVSIEKDYKTNECYITEYELDPIVTQQGEYTAYKLEDYTDELASQNRIKYREGCSNFSVEYINDLCSEILGDDFSKSEQKVKVRLR